MTFPTTPSGRFDGARPANANPLRPLPELAHCFIGFPMEEARKDTDQKVYLLQAHDVQDGTIPPRPERAVIANLPAEQVLQAGDIILAQAGDGLRAMLCNSPLPATVCAAPMLVVRVRDQQLLDPAWLCCYLHTATVQCMLCQHMSPPDAHEGALEGLQRMSVPVPTRAGQQRLVEMAKQFAAMEHMAVEALNLQKRNNEAIWLALARGEQG
jgi:hypothetical protein